ncbi:MAG: hypothetical protein ACRD26_24935 [Vicinamibacterales bacterium]
MIEGFKVDVTAEELVAHLDGRAQHHRERLLECESKLRQLQTLEPGPHTEEEDFEMCTASRLHGVERLVERHRSRELFLMFARNHVVATEIYRLTEDDLRLLEWLPTEPSLMVNRF